MSDDGVYEPGTRFREALRGGAISLDITASNLTPEGVAILLGGHAGEEPRPVVGAIIDYEKAGRAGLNRVQEQIRRRGRRRPDWVWDMVADKPCWANRSKRRVVFTGRIEAIEGADGTFSVEARAQA